MPVKPVADLIGPVMGPEDHYATDENIETEPENISAWPPRIMYITFDLAGTRAKMEEGSAAHIGDPKPD